VGAAVITKREIRRVGLDPDGLYEIYRDGFMRVRINRSASFRSPTSGLWIVLTSTESGLDVCRSQPRDVRRLARMVVTDG